MHLAALLAISVATAVSAVNLFVSDYGGNVTTLAFNQEMTGNYSLTAIHSNLGCAPNPSWLTLDSPARLLFCANEGLATPNGSLTTFAINSNGSLTSLSNITTLPGPVNAVLYGIHPKALALADYAGSALSAYLLRDSKPAFTHSFPFTLPHPGVDPEGRQTSPHPHQVLVDPTSQYLLSPDLGSDLIHIFAIDPETLALTPRDPIVATPGSGPRHGVFYTPSGFPGPAKTYFYLVEELSAHLSRYEVSYLPSHAGLNFTLLNSQPATWLFNLPRRNAPAEIRISPDNRFLIISNRNDSSFALPRPVAVDSDSLSTWSLDPATGDLSFLQLWPAGGSFPRSFSLSKTGQFVAVGLQSIQTVAILSRDVASGLIGEPVARITLGGNVTSVVWDDEVPSMGVGGGVGMGYVG